MSRNLDTSLRSPVKATPTRSARPRRTQAERTASTRAALLEATVEMLAEHGFGGLSTTAIATRAGVSRGAQLHHFPSKADLVAAASEHLFHQAEQIFRAAFAALPDEQRNQAGAIAMFSEVALTPQARAVAELVGAARTDAELRPLAARVLRNCERAIAEIFAEILPEAGADPFLVHRVLVSDALLSSAALHRSLGMEEEATQLVEALQYLGSLFPFVAEQPHDRTAPSVGIQPPDAVVGP